MYLLRLDQLVLFRSKTFGGVKTFAVGLDGVNLSLRQNDDGGWKKEIESLYSWKELTLNFEKNINLKGLKTIKINEVQDFTVKEIIRIIFISFQIFTLN